MLRLLLISACLVTSTLATAQTVDPSELDAITRAEAEAKAKADKLAKEQASVETEILSFKEDLRRSAAESASYEKASREIDDKLKTLTRQETQLSGRLSDDHKAQNELLAALQRLSTTPTMAVTLSTDNALSAARASMMMANLTTQLETRSKSLSTQLGELSSLRNDIASERQKLGENEAALSEKRRTIRALVKEKSERAARLSDNAKAAQERAKTLAAKASDLRELIKRFERAADDVVPRVKPTPGSGRATPRVKPKSGSRAPEPLKLPEGTRFADARGGLRPPVQGRLKSGYGSGRKGLTVSTRAQAQVTAPFTGRIEFAGAFKNYDNVVILNVGENYFMLMTGLGEIFVDSGEMVKLGEPVGLMPENTSAAELYIELRKNGAPINPKPWLGGAFSAQG